MVKTDSKIPHGLVAYLMGVIGIVLAFLSTYGLGGIVFGIIGLFYCRKEKSDLSKRAKKLNIISIVVGVILMILTVTINAYLISQGTLQFPQ